MSEWKAKRFWKQADVAEDGAGFAVHLDGRPVKTPAKAMLALPTKDLADEVAREWNEVGEHIDPTVMPFTRSANAAIDKVAVQFDEVATLLSDYGDSDLLCYRADAPVELVARQAQSWDPVLEWLATEYDARLEPRTGIMHAPQSAAALARLDAAVRAHSAFELTAFHDLVSLSGSLGLALAVTRGRLDAETAWTLSRIDESWQIDQWGEDEEAMAQAEIKRQSFMHAATFFRLSRISS